MGTARLGGVPAAPALSSVGPQTLGGGPSRSRGNPPTGVTGQSTPPASSSASAPSSSRAVTASGQQKMASFSLQTHGERWAGGVSRRGAETEMGLGNTLVRSYSAAECNRAQPFIGLTRRLMSPPSSQNRLMTAPIKTAETPSRCGGGDGGGQGGDRSYIILRGINGTKN